MTRTIDTKMKLQRLAEKARHLSNGENGPATEFSLTLALATAELRLVRDHAGAARDWILPGGCPISTSQIWMDTYGNRLRRLAYPLAMGCLPQASARLFLHDRVIVLQAISLDSITSICR